MSSLRVNDIFDELLEENKRLLNDLRFADKCLNVLIKFKSFVDLFCVKLKTNLETNDLQIFEELCEELEEVVNINKSFVLNSHQLIGKEVIDQKPNLFNDFSYVEDTNQTSIIDQSFDELIAKNSLNVLFNEDFDITNDLDLNGVPLKCNDNGCHLSFYRPSDLRNHSKTVHSIDKPFKCYFMGCERRYSDYQNLKDHINRHNGITRYVCDYDSCGKRFVTKTLLKRHLNVCHLTKERTFKCEVCPKAFKSFPSLYIHRQCHRTDRPYACDRPDCQFRAKSRSNLRNHFKFRHSDERPFVCTVVGCGVAYKSNGELKYHILNIHSNGEEFKCGLNECEKVFNTKYKLALHRKYCNTNVWHSCEWPGCEFKTKNQRNLRKHQMNIHSDEKVVTERKYVCDYECCGYSFIQKSHLKQHINLHKGIKPFVCEYESCHKCFASKDLLRRHTKNCHLIKKTFKCEFESCDKMFKTKGLLSTHQLTHGESKPFRCEQPGCLYRTHCQSSFRIHLKITHSSERNFKCPIDGCPSSFKTNPNLREHMKTVHISERLFVCDVNACGKAFKSEITLKRHHQKLHMERESLFCDWPGCEFSTKCQNSLREHKVFHQNKREFGCDWPQCHKRFNTKAKLSEHIRIHKCDKRYVCSWPGCSYRCVLSGNLKKHMRIHQK